MEPNSKWYVKIGGSQIFGPVVLETLISWAEQARVLADHEVSPDRQHWQLAKTLPELKLDTIVQLPNGTSGGPFNRKAAEALIASGKIPANAKLISPVENQPAPETEKKEEEATKEAEVRERDDHPEEIEEKREKIQESAEEEEKDVTQEDFPLVVEPEESEEKSEDPLPELPLAEVSQPQEEKMNEDASIRQEYEELKAAAEKLREECEKFKAESEEYKAASEKFKTESEELKAESEKLKAELEKRKVEINELKASEKQLTAERDALAQQVAGISAEFNTKLQKLETEITELKTRNETLVKNCMLPPEAVEKFEDDRKAVFELMEDEAEKLASSLEGEYKLLEQIKALIAEREEMMLNKRRDYLRLVGGGPAGMLRRYQAGLNP